MRRPVDADRLRRFLRAFGRPSERDTRVYLTGGATAVLYGWRAMTNDVDIKIVPESDELLRAVPALKEELEINVELAAPDQFIPPLPGWEQRSPFIQREGSVSYHHYDLSSQALAKIERGHAQDLEDVRQMAERRLIDPGELERLFALIEPDLYRYPALDAPTFHRAVEDFVREIRNEPAP